VKVSETWNARVLTSCWTYPIKENNIHQKQQLSYHIEASVIVPPPTSTWLSKAAGPVEVGDQSVPFLHAIAPTKRSTDRKVKCDLALPTCDNCRHRNLQCQGYGLRLSWPRKGDQRRSIEFKSTTDQRKHTLAILYRHRHFLNMTNRDINMFYKLSEAKSNCKPLYSFSVCSTC
jgi:hypothetical protein